MVNQAVSRRVMPQCSDRQGKLEVLGRGIDQDILWREKSRRRCRASWLSYDLDHARCRAQNFTCSQHGHKSSGAVDVICNTQKLDKKIQGFSPPWRGVRCIGKNITRAFNERSCGRGGALLPTPQKVLSGTRK